jgi:hypothetical protein
VSLREIVLFFTASKPFREASGEAANRGLLAGSQFEQAWVMKGGRQVKHVCYHRTFLAERSLGFPTKEVRSENSGENDALSLPFPCRRVFPDDRMA